MRLVPLLLALTTAQAAEGLICDDSSPLVECYPQEMAIRFTAPAVSVNTWTTVATDAEEFEASCPQGEGAQLRVRPSGVAEARCLAGADTVCELYAGDLGGHIWTVLVDCT